MIIPLDVFAHIVSFIPNVYGCHMGIEYIHKLSSLFFDYREATSRGIFVHSHRSLDGLVYIHKALLAKHADTLDNITIAIASYARYDEDHQSVTSGLLYPSPIAHMIMMMSSHQPCRPVAFIDAIYRLVDHRKLAIMAISPYHLLRTVIAYILPMDDDEARGKLLTWATAFGMDGLDMGILIDALDDSVLENFMGQTINGVKISRARHIDVADMRKYAMSETATLADGYRVYANISPTGIVYPSTIRRSRLTFIVTCLLQSDHYKYRERIEEYLPLIEEIVANGVGYDMEHDSGGVFRADGDFVAPSSQQDNLLGSRDNLLGSRDNPLGSRDNPLGSRDDSHRPWEMATAYFMWVLRKNYKHYRHADWYERVATLFVVPKVERDCPKWGKVRGDPLGDSRVVNAILTWQMPRKFYDFLKATNSTYAARIAYPQYTAAGELIRHSGRVTRGPPVRQGYTFCYRRGFRAGRGHPMLKPGYF